MKDILRRNNLDGRLQGVVLGALRAGRAKKRNVCLLGDADSGKSFLFRGFKEIFSVYERPDGGNVPARGITRKGVGLPERFRI